MNSRARIKNILDRKNNGGPGFWTGHPSDNAVPVLTKAWGIEENRESIYRHLNDDCRWIIADRGYKKIAFNPSYGIERGSLSAEGCLANAETIADIDKYPWPELDNFDFSDVYAEVDKFQNKMVFTGLWCCFYHIVADFFGMENYFIKMYESPEIVEAVTQRVVDFFVAGSEEYFKGLGDRADVMFFGNDFGTQLDLFISPEHFRKFILPSMKRLINVGKKYGKKIAIHSCGSIIKIIPDLIDAGVDILHPLQAQAVGMSAQNLKQFSKDIAFMGGIDAQTFIVNAAPAQVEEEVARVWEILGPNIIISPSHEEILENVPPANVLAISRAVEKLRGI